MVQSPPPGKRTLPYEPYTYLLFISGIIFLFFGAQLRALTPSFQHTTYVLEESDTPVATKLPFELTSTDAKGIRIVTEMQLTALHPAVYHFQYDDCLDELMVNEQIVPGGPFCNYPKGNNLNIQRFLHPGINHVIAQISNKTGGATFSVSPSATDPIQIASVLCLAILFVVLLFSSAAWRQRLKWYHFTAAGLGAVVLAFCFLLIKTQSYFGDEGFHIEQIQKFLRSDFTMAGSITMIPGYHALMAAGGFLTGLQSLEWYRYFSFFFSMLSVLVFHRIASRTDRKTAFPLTLQYVFFPILFPFFFLLYTDVTGLFFVLLSFMLLLDRRYALAALAGIASVLLRQNNILYFALFYLFLLLGETDVTAQMRFQLRKGFQIAVHWSTSSLRKLFSPGSLFFLAGFALFVAFVVWNGGVAIGDKGSHPFPAIHLGNVYFLLFCSFFLFLPLQLAALPRIGSLVRRHPTIILAILLFIVFGVFTFVNSHGYNQGADSPFLRNRLLVYFASDHLHKLVFILVGTWSLLTFALTPMLRRSYYLLYPFTFFVLTSAWLIEQRYYLVFFALFMLMRQKETVRIERLLAVYTIVFNAILFYHIVVRTFFL